MEPNDLPEEWKEVVSDVEQAIRLSEEKYCSASAMFSARANIKSKYIIHPTGESLLSV
jgi:hypothetical protein